MISLHFIESMYLTYGTFLLGGSVHSSMYALEGAVDFPQPQDCLYVCCIHSVYNFLYLSESLLGASPPPSISALEGAVEFPHTRSCLYVCVYTM